MSSAVMTIVFLNGEFLPQEQAKISVMDRGFLFGDGVYEVIPVYNDKIFQFKHHIDRLNKSLNDIKLSVDLAYSDWDKIFTQLLQHNAEFGANQSIYLQITRGESNERNHAFPKIIKPTIFAFSSPLRTLSYEELQKGKTAITHVDTRWQLCNIKAISLLANILLYQQGLDKHAAETILIRDNKVIEGSTSNLFIVKDNTLITPPLSQWILGGITRDLVLTLAKDNQLPYREADIEKDQLFSADEVWITSSTREIYPIIKVDQTTINDGKPGNMWYKMIKLYHEFIKNL